MVSSMSGVRYNKWLKHSSHISPTPQANLSGWFERSISLWPARRYLQLRGTTLIYSHGPQQVAQWSEDVRECEISPGTHVREIVVKRPGVDARYRLYAMSSDEMREWFSELKRVGENLQMFYRVAAQMSHMNRTPILLARDRECGSTQVSVFVHEKYALSAGMLQALSKREARIVRATQTHGSVLRVVDVFHTHRRVYVVTEAVFGGMLCDAMKHAGMQDVGTRRRVAKSVGRDVLRGLAHCHGLGLVHGAVDGRHVLCSGRLPCATKLVTFGVAQTAGEDERLYAGGHSGCSSSSGSGGSGGGWTGWMRDDCGGCVAPETVCFQERSSKSDVFAAGALLFWLITGRRMFDGASDADYLSCVSRGPVEDDEAWGSLGDAQDLVRSMVREHADARPSAQVCARHPWLTSRDVKVEEAVEAVEADDEADVPVVEEVDKPVDKPADKPADTTTTTTGSGLSRERSDPKTVIVDFDQ